MSNSRHDVILWGATGQAKVINEAISTQFKIVALFDNREVPSPLNGVPVFYGMEEFNRWLKNRSSHNLFAAPAIGGANGKDRLYFLNIFLERGLNILSIRHDSAFIARDSVIGIGCQILAHANICSCASLGNGVIANTASIIEHDCIIEDGAHIGPGATLAGEVVVKKNAFIGAGAVVLPGITIGENSVVGAGAVVTKNILDNAIVLGNPARLYK